MTKQSKYSTEFFDIFLACPCAFRCAHAHKDTPKKHLITNS
ncbi:MAG: hypothetical protein NZ455_02405 [Bacteroidia bacterium]|nr:hypothetical protein [Bacteroidia bacterium]MDW8346382.1 hypothetical protein [Bacteroidia bacterium]